jgi:hypothetical protein
VEKKWVASKNSEMLKLARVPHSLIASLATLPSMSLIPFAPFARRSPREQALGRLSRQATGYCRRHACLYRSLQLVQPPLQPKSTVPVQIGFNSSLCVANFEAASGRSKSSAAALDAARSLIGASIESISAIWSDPIAKASRRFDSLAEIRDDNCDSPRQM